MAQMNGIANEHGKTFGDAVSLSASLEDTAFPLSNSGLQLSKAEISRKFPEGLDDIAHLLLFASQGNVVLTTKVIQSGVDVNQSDYDGRTALHLAASEGQTEVIKLLLSMGANVNPVDRWGSTPLADSMHYGFLEASKLLKASGGRVPVRSGYLSSSPSPARSTDDDFEIDVSELDFQNARLVGKGAFGEINVVKWGGTRVSVKAISHTQLSAKPQVEKEFHEELKLLKKLRHPNIVQFLGAVTLTQPMMLITEYLSRGDLHDILKRKGALSAAEAVHYALDIARGMSYLHQHKPDPIVHRDLKTKNLHRDEAGHLKVADFGLSRLLKAQSTEEMLEAFDWSRDKSSFLYLAPELLLKKSYDKSVDVYSLAVIVFEMFEGSYWDGGDPEETAKRRAEENVRPEFEATNYPPGMKALIMRCWDQDPNKRPLFSEIVGILEAMEAKLYRDRHRGHGTRNSEFQKNHDRGCRCIVM